MPNAMFPNSNEVKNGYIYKELNNRLLIMEKEMRSIFNILDSLKKDDITQTQLDELYKELIKRPTYEEFNQHTTNSNIHVNSFKVNDWDSKYSKPITGIPEEDLDQNVITKLNATVEEVTSLNFTTYIENTETNEFILNHELNSVNVSVTIFDEAGKLCLTTMYIMDNNSVKIILHPDLEKQRFRVTIKK